MALLVKKMVGAIEIKYLYGIQGWCPGFVVKKYKI